VIPFSEVRLLSLPVSEHLGAAHGATAGPARELVVVALDDGDAVGWGECSALTTPGYSHEHARAGYELLTAGVPIDRESYPMAAAAVEMAELDLLLRRADQSLAEHFGVEVESVPAGATLGIGPESTTVERARAMAGAGYRRVKLKIDPAHASSIVAAVRAAVPDVEIHVDANGSFAPTEVSELYTLDKLGVTVIEQPFPADDTIATATLVSSVEATVVADEAVGSVADAERLLAEGALGGVSIKPARVGGLAAALQLLDWCVEHGVDALAGGMLESGLGRHALAAFAGLPGFTIAGDISPSSRWFAADPWPDITMIDGRVLVPRAAGVAPAPDPEMLDRLTIAVTTR